MQELNYNKYIMGHYQKFGKDQILDNQIIINKIYINRV